MTLLEQAWGDKQGFVCISTKRNREWHDEFFRWPKDREKIQPFIEKSDEEGYDVYWSWQVYRDARRRKDGILEPVTVLGSDCDYARPDTFSSKPSVVIETSSGRHHALWFLPSDGGLDCVFAERVSRKVSYDNLCDKGGWDLPQVLRVPGTHNRKNGGNFRVTVVREDVGHRISADALERQEPVVDRLLRDARCTRDIRRLHSRRAEDRSDALWALESACKQAGFTQDEAFMLAWSSVNNKFKDRERGGEQIWTEVQKVWRDGGSETPRKSSSPDTPYPGRVEWTSFSALMRQSFDRPRWLVRDIWQEGSHGILAGEPKTYKSVLSTDLAVSVATGTPFLGTFPVEKQGTVLIVQEENDPFTVQDRVMKVMHSRNMLPEVRLTDTGVEVEYPPILPITFRNNMGTDLTNRNNLLGLEQKIAELHPVLVILDPLYLMLGGADENSASELRPILNWLMQIRFVYKCSVMVIHHFRKAESARGGQRMLGSTTFHGWAESGLYTRVKETGILLEREFRAFKRQDLYISLEMADLGEMGYSVTCSDAIVDKEQEIIRVLGESESGTHIDALAHVLGISPPRVKKIVREMGESTVLLGRDGIARLRQ